MVDTAIIEQIEVGPMQNYVYFIGDPASREVFIIDPAWDIPYLIRTARDKNLQIRGAIITHYHFDHASGVEELVNNLEIPAYTNKHEMEYLGSSKKFYQPVDDGEKQKIGAHEVEFIHTPGHTPGSHCILLDGQFLFTGDTLFIAGCGRCDLPGGSAKELYHSLKKLMKFPDATVVYPGHNYAPQRFTTVGQERQHNPFLQFSLEKFLQSH